jgi:hypothetical protein
VILALILLRNSVRIPDRTAYTASKCGSTSELHSGVMFKINGFLANPFILTVALLTFICNCMLNTLAFNNVLK